MSDEEHKIDPGYLGRKLVLTESVERLFRDLLDENRARTRGVDRCLARFTSAVHRLQSDQTGAALVAVNESHNELCVVEALLRSVDPALSLIEYEPTLPLGKRRIDFRATDNPATVFVEVKTIQPDLNDRWDQYERVVEAGHIAENVTLHFERQWMGGALWHQRFTARSRMIEYAMDFEERILEAGIDAPENRFVLALFTDGFAWHEDELEDFVAFYRSGRHRLDDGLGKMERHALTGKTLSRRISAFGYFCRPAFEASPTAINWNVQPPKERWVSK